MCRNIWFFLLLINLLFVTMGTVDIATRYAVQKNVNLSKSHVKHWYQYCKMMLYQCFNRNILDHIYNNDKFVRIQLLRCSEIFLRYRLKIEKPQVKKVERTFTSSTYYKYMSTIKRVSGNISAYVFDTHMSNYLMYQYNFWTDVSIRMNITIYTLYTYGGFQSCDEQTINFATFIGGQRKRHIFCYHLSTFHFYPYSNRLLIMFYTKSLFESIFNSSFSVIDTNVLHTDSELMEI